MIIKAKYPIIGNDFVGYQGFGSLYVNNTISVVSNEDTIHSEIRNREFNQEFNNSFK